MRVLCLGDSLTEGFTGPVFAPHFHPYTKELACQLAAVLDAEVEKLGTPNEPRYSEVLRRGDQVLLHVDNFGVSGETSDAIFHRLQSHVLPKPHSHDFVAAVVLMGTNDLGTLEGSEIFENISKTFEYLERADIRCLAMTLPTHGMEFSRQFSFIGERRRQANSLLRTFCAEKSMPLVDLSLALPHFPGLEDSSFEAGIPPTPSKDDLPTMDEAWFDHLHFSAAGYDKIGALVAAPLGNMLKELTLTVSGDSQRDSSVGDSQTKTPIERARRAHLQHASLGPIRDGRVRVTLVRHGETLYNAERRVQGCSINADLNSRGRRQAALLGHRLSRENFDVIACSPLARAKQTCAVVVHSVDEKVHAQTDLNDVDAEVVLSPDEIEGMRRVVEHPGFVEMSFGEFEGRFASEIREEVSLVEKRWACGDLDAAVPGGESPSMMVDRAQNALQALVDRPEIRSVLVVAHGRLLRGLISSLLDNFGLSAMARLPQHNTCVNILEYDRSSRSYEEILLNCTEHLADSDVERR